MASEQLRHASIFMPNKIASMTQADYGGASGDESQITDGGYFGHTDGAETTTLSVDTIEPVRPSDSAKLVKALREKKYIKISIALISGQVHQVEMRCVKYQFTSDPKTGKLTGKFDFEGGPATLVG